MKFENIDTADQIVYPKGLTVGKLHGFLTSVMAVGKEHVQVFLNDGSDYSPTLALGSVRLNEKNPEAAITAAVVPENRFEAVVVDYLRSLDDGYVCLTGSHPALAFERLDMVYEQMVKRAQAANDPTAASEKVDAKDVYRGCDPYGDDLTVGDIQQVIEGGLAKGTLTKDSPFRVYADSYVAARVLRVREKDARAVAEPIDDQEKAALEAYGRCNVNHVSLLGEERPFDSQAMDRHIDDMRERAASIPALAVKVPLAA